MIYAKKKFNISVSIHHYIDTKSYMGLKFKKKPKLICFDIDGTLVDGVSWLILTEGLGCSVQKHLDLFHCAKEGKTPFPEAGKQLLKMYQEGQKATKTNIRNIFKNVKLRSEVKPLIFHLKKKNYLIYLISGAINIYVEEIAKKIKADGYYANTTLDFDRTEKLSKINYREKQSKIKLEQLQELVNNLNIGMDEVVFVGDSENDIDVFKATEHGIAVHCFDENLKKVAWKVVDSLDEIKSIL